MSQYKIRIAYSGSSVSEGIINADDFAQALMSISKLIKRAAVMYDKEITPEVIFSVQGVRTGSVDLTLLVRDAIFATIPLLSEGGLEYVLKCIGFMVDKSIVSFFDAIRQIPTGKVENMCQDVRGDVSITGNNGCSIIVNKFVGGLYCDPNIRQEVGGVLYPLRKNGVDNFEVRNADNDADMRALNSISKSDIGIDGSRECGVEGKVISDNVRRNVRCECLSVSFDDKKWRFFDGDKNFSASVNDREFLEEVRVGKKEFRKGTTVVDIREIQRLSPNGSSSIERSIEKVIDYFPGPEQIRLIK